MSKKQKQAQQQLQRSFMIAKGFLCITPVICYLYIQLQGMMQAIPFQEVIAKHPSITILFFISMLNPYIAYLLHLIQKKLEENNVSFAIINMGLLLISQVFTMNVFYFGMLLYVFYRACHYYQIPIKQTLQTYTFRNSFIHGGGSMLIVILSSICLFATIQLI